MLPVIARSLFAVILTCVIALNGFISPAYASTESSVNSFTDGFWQAVGGVVGGAVGIVATCYAVDVLIAPAMPPVAVYLAGTCPAIGATVGGVSGAVGAKTVVEAL